MDAWIESAAGAQTFQAVSALVWLVGPDTMACQLVTSWVPAGTSWYQLMPADTSWVPAGYQLGTSWYQLGTSWVPAGYQLVPAWYQPGTSLVPAWYQLGTSWVPAGTSWRQLGTSCYPTGHSWSRDPLWNPRKLSRTPRPSYPFPRRLLATNHVRSQWQGKSPAQRSIDNSSHLPWG